MGNCIQGCYECIHSIGPNAKFIRCKYCGEKKWRGHRTVDYVRENGCVICRYKNKMSSSKINKTSSSKCRGRYDDLEDIDLNSINRIEVIKRGKYFIVVFFYVQRFQLYQQNPFFVL